MFGSYHLLSRLWIWITYELIHSRLGFTAVFIQFYLWFKSSTECTEKLTEFTNVREHTHL